jgi:PAS domain S-box-containing protein
VRLNQVAPTTVERTFARDEIIVSKTDLRGHITYANDVFARVSGYTRSELVGRPHSVIRHPDMPRAVFHLLWSTIQRGDEIFAYVKNLASDGAFYWVLAHVTPSRDTAGKVVGYHSNRRLPEPAEIRAAERLYRPMLEAEARERTGKAAVAAGAAELEALLARAGKPYDELVWDLINSGGVAR